MKANKIKVRMFNVTYVDMSKMSIEQKVMSQSELSPMYKDKAFKILEKKAVDCVLHETPELSEFIQKMIDNNEYDIVEVTSRKKSSESEVE